MKRFECRELEEAIDYAARGGQALHLHRIVFLDSPRCFQDAVARGEHIAHLFDRDAGRLVRTARQLGVRIIVVDKQGSEFQHVDLVGGPLRRALALCVNKATKVCEDDLSQ